MSLHQSHSPKPHASETAQPSLAQENNQLAESAYITSDYQKASTNREFGNETETKFDSSSPDRHFNSSRYSVDDKQPYSAYSTAGLTSNIGSAALNYQYSSRDYTQPSTYGISAYQSAPKTESSGPGTQSYSYSSYKHETTSPTIKALNENTATLLGRSAALDSSNFGKSSLTLHGLAPENRTLSFGASNYSTDLKNLGLGKEEYKTSFTAEAKPDLKYSDYLKSKPTTFDYGKSPYETTFGSTANPIPTGTAGGIEGTSSSLYKDYSLKDEETRKSALQSNKGLYSSTDYSDLINKISNKNNDTTTTKNDNYTIIKPDSLNNTEKKQRQTYGSHYYQSTYPNTVRTPSESGKKDRYANSEMSVVSPPFKRDRAEVERHSEVIDDYVISEPHITKKTLYTIENANSVSINGGKDLVNQIALHRTPDRKIKAKSGSPSPFDDLKHALKNESVQISKIVIETVENYGGEGETYEPAVAPVTTHNRHGSEKFDIVMEQHQHTGGLLHHRNHSRNESIKSPSNIKIQRNLVEESSSFKEQPHHLHHHSRKHSDASSSKVGGTINAINERIKDLDSYLNSGTRSASKQSNLVSPNAKAESSGIHHRVHHHHHHEEKPAAAPPQYLKEKDEKERARLEKERIKAENEKEKERVKAEKEKEKERVKAEKEKEKEREKREKEEAKLKAKQAAALAKEANKHHQGGSGHLIVKLIIGFIILLLLGVLSFELIMGAEEYDALLDTPLNKVLP